MKKCLYAFIFATPLCYSCQKSILENSTAGFNDLSNTGKPWRLYGEKSDTTRQADWSIINYSLQSFYSDYYCVPTPDYSPYNGRDFFSPYKCTVWLNNCYYILPDEYCDWDRKPVLTDTIQTQNLTNDLTFNPDNSFNLHLSSAQSKWIDWFNSTCSDIKYYPAAKSDYGYNGTWQIDPINNIITLNYEQAHGVCADIAGTVYDFTDTTLPRVETWKIMEKTESSLSLNNCLTCPADSGYRKMFKTF
jgi:hypothetical protein